MLFRLEEAMAMLVLSSLLEGECLILRKGEEEILYFDDRGVKP